MPTNAGTGAYESGGNLDTIAAVIGKATVWAAGELRVQQQPTQQFFTAFDAGLDTTNIWKPPTAAGGGVAATSAPTATVLGSGTTASGYSYLESQATFLPESPGWLLVQCAMSIEFPVSTNAYRFWGLGTSPATPTAAAPLTNAAGFEVATTGKMYAVVYASGTRFVVQDLSIATGNGKQPQDNNTYSYNMYFRGDKIYFSIGSLDNTVAQTFGFPGPDINTLPTKLTAIANTTPPGASVLLTCGAVTVAATSRNNMQLSDATYQWRKATIDATGALSVREASSNAAVAAGAGTAAVVVKASKGYLKGVLVTATGSANLLLYDNASAASGTVIGFVPSTATLGQYFVTEMPATNGITAGQLSGTPAVTASFG
jgi:hypothetical protein